MGLKDSTHGGFRFICVRMLLTMCNRPRNDILVYDKATSRYEIYDLHKDFGKYECDPALTFDYGAIEEGYQVYIANKMLLYDHKRGIERTAKVGKIGATTT